jgi:hypothetical protein
MCSRLPSAIKLVFNLLNIIHLCNNILPQHPNTDPTPHSAPDQSTTPLIDENQLPRQHHLFDSPTPNLRSPFGIISVHNSIPQRETHQRQNENTPPSQRNNTEYSATMVGKILNNCRICIGFPIPAWKAKTSDWSIAKVTSWVKSAGGTVQQHFDGATATHLVVDEKQWQNKTRAVQSALEFNASESGRKIHIVSPDWLETCLEEQRKIREATYLWEKLDQVASSSKQKKRGRSGGDDEDAGENAGETRKAPQALLGEVFLESTEPFVEERDLRAYEAELAGKAKARKEREEAEARMKKLERLEAEKKRRERAEMMRKTVKRGRGEVFNGEYLFQPSASTWPHLMSVRSASERQS